VTYASQTEYPNNLTSQRSGANDDSMEIPHAAGFERSTLNAQGFNRSLTKLGALGIRLMFLG
jgi:hypothetical protein